MLTALFLKFLEWLVAQIELRVIDYEHGGFLPVEKRGLYPQAQKRVGKALVRLSQSRVVAKQEPLRSKLWILGLVLQDKESPSIVPAELFQTCKPRRG